MLFFHSFKYILPLLCIFPEISELWLVFMAGTKIYMCTQAHFLGKMKLVEKIPEFDL